MQRKTKTAMRAVDHEVLKGLKLTAQLEKVKSDLAKAQQQARDSAAEHKAQAVSQGTAMKTAVQTAMATTLTSHRRVEQEHAADDARSALATSSAASVASARDDALLKHEAERAYQARKREDKRNDELAREQAARAYRHRCQGNNFCTRFRRSS
jgi:hypothetical protein